MLIAKHFVSTYPEAINECKVSISEEIWQRNVIDGKPHHHGFQKVGPQTGYAFCHAIRDENNDVVVKTLNGGIRSLTILKTTQSAFENFIRDQYTILPETSERCKCFLVTPLFPTCFYLFLTHVNCIL